MGILIKNQRSLLILFHPSVIYLLHHSVSSKPGTKHTLQRERTSSSRMICCTDVHCASLKPRLHFCDWVGHESRPREPWSSKTCKISCVQIRCQCWRCIQCTATVRPRILYCVKWLSGSERWLCSWLRLLKGDAWVVYKTSIVYFFSLNSLRKRVKHEWRQVKVS